MPPELATRLQDYLAALLPEALQWLKRLVEVNSFTANPPGVNRVGEITAELFAELGFVPEYVKSEYAEHGSHLYLRRRNFGQEKPVLLVTHLDTVYPAEEEILNHFHWEESPEEQRIYGPGTVDIKGGSVLIWMMLKALQNVAPDVYEKTSWLIAANSSEEVMSRDFGVRTNERCPDGAKAVLVFEGGPREGDLQHLVIARKGRAEYRISAEGRAAHAGSNHPFGINAVVALSGMLPQVAALTDYEKNLTVNLASIHGGTVLNRVPHEAVAELEMRAFHPELIEQTGAAIANVAAEQSQNTGTKLKVECLGTSPAWPPQDVSLELFAQWRDVATRLGIAVKSVSRGGLSDANYLYHLGPTLDGLGPSGGNAHCSERSADGSKMPEFVEVESFVPKATWNALSLIQWLER